MTTNLQQQAENRGSWKSKIKLLTASLNLVHILTWISYFYALKKKRRNPILIWALSHSSPQETIRRPLGWIALQLFSGDHLPLLLFFIHLTFAAFLKIQINGRISEKINFIDILWSFGRYMQPYLKWVFFLRLKIKFCFLI